MSWGCCWLLLAVFFGLGYLRDSSLLGIWGGLIEITASSCLVFYNGCITANISSTPLSLTNLSSAFPEPVSNHKGPPHIFRNFKIGFLAAILAAYCFGVEIVLFPPKLALVWTGVYLLIFWPGLPRLSAEVWGSESGAAALEP